MGPGHPPPQGYGQLPLKVEWVGNLREGAGDEERGGCSPFGERTVTGAGRGWGRRMSRNKKGASAIDSLSYPGDKPTSAPLSIPEVESEGGPGGPGRWGVGMQRATWVGKG